MLLIGYGFFLAPRPRGSRRIAVGATSTSVDRIRHVHCRRRLRSAWTVRTPHHQTRQGPWVWAGRRRGSVSTQAPPAPSVSLVPSRTSRHCSAGPYGSSGRLSARPSFDKPRVPSALPDDARSLPPFGVGRPTLGALPCGPQRIGHTLAPSDQVFLEPSGVRRLAPLVAGPRCPSSHHRAAFVTPPATAGRGRSAMPSIDAGGSRLNRPAYPPQVPAGAR